MTTAVRASMLPAQKKATKSGENRHVFCRRFRKYMTGCVFDLTFLRISRILNLYGYQCQQLKRLRQSVNCCAIHLGAPSIAGRPSRQNDPPDRFARFTPAELLTIGEFRALRCATRGRCPLDSCKLLKKFDQNCYFGFAVRVLSC